MAVVPVFMSSTFRDFHGERDVLAAGVRERLDEQLKDLGCRVGDHRPAVGRRHHRRRREEAARRVVDVCLQQVARARPLFRQALVGERVGYIPDGVHARWVADQAECQRRSASRAVGHRAGVRVQDAVGLRPRR